MAWRIACEDGEPEDSESVESLLLENAGLTGKSPWREMSLAFTVPDTNCSHQLLRLEASSQYAHKHAFKGSAWFDDVSILRGNKEVKAQ